MSEAPLYSDSRLNPCLQARVSTWVRSSAMKGSTRVRRKRRYGCRVWGSVYIHICREKRKLWLDGRKLSLPSAPGRVSRERLSSGSRLLSLARCLFSLSLALCDLSLSLFLSLFLSLYLSFSRALSGLSRSSTYKTVTTRIWLWLAGESPENLSSGSSFAQKRRVA